MGAGWWLGVPRCCSVGMQLCFDSFTGSCCGGSLICSCVLEHGLVMGLSLCGGSCNGSILML